MRWRLLCVPLAISCSGYCLLMFSSPLCLVTQLTTLHTLDTDVLHAWQASLDQHDAVTHSTPRRKYTLQTPHVIHSLKRPRCTSPPLRQGAGTMPPGGPSAATSLGDTCSQTPYTARHVRHACCNTSRGLGLLGPDHITCTFC